VKVRLVSNLSEITADSKGPWGEITKYEAYSERKYSFTVKNSIKVSYNVLLLSDSTIFELFFHIFADHF